MSENSKVVKKGKGIFGGESTNRQSWILGIALIALVVVMSIATDKFLQPSNIMNIFVQIATLGICALGAGLVMISG